LGVPINIGSDHHRQGSEGNFVSEGLRLAVLSRLCEMLVIDQTNGGAELDPPDSVQASISNMKPSSASSSSAVYVYWNPVKGAQFDLMDNWSGVPPPSSSTSSSSSSTGGVGGSLSSSNQFMSRDSWGNRSHRNMRRGSDDNDGDNVYSNEDYVRYGPSSSSNLFSYGTIERQDIEDRVVVKVAATLKFGVNEKVLRKVVSSSLETLLNGSIGEDPGSSLPSTANGGGIAASSSSSSVLLPDIRGLGMASLTALVQAAAASELARTRNNNLETTDAIHTNSLSSASSVSSPPTHSSLASPKLHHGGGRYSSSSVGGAGAIGSLGTNTTHESRKTRQRRNAPFTPVLPTDNLTSYSLPCPVLSKKRGGKGSPSKLPPLPMVPFQWGYNR
jgi:hypothetical protein